MVVPRLMERVLTPHWRGVDFEPVEAGAWPPPNAPPHIIATRRAPKTADWLTTTATRVAAPRAPPPPVPLTKAEEAVDTPVVVGLVMNVAVAVALITDQIFQLILLDLEIQMEL